MASRGLFFGEGPTACPFVALENDRDRRAEEPDHRHRCYAEPVPAPRALAHQREYCLAAAFTVCPIFQDWAIRAAATPVPLRPARLPDREREAEPTWASAPPWFAEEGASEPATGAAGATVEPTDVEHAANAGERSQPSPESGPSKAGGPPTRDEVGLFPAAELAADGFVAPPAPEPHPPETAPRVSSEIERVPSLPREDGIPPTADRPSPTAARRPVPAPAPPPRDDAPPPPFLSGRAQRPGYVEPRRPERQPAQAERALPSEKLRREDLVPAWGRGSLYPYGKAGRIDYGHGGGRISRLTALLAVGVILALAVSAVILAPSLLVGSFGNPGPTAPVAGASPTSAEPTPTRRPTPTPDPTPITYTVLPGDTIFSIALRHGLTVEQLLAANPQIANPDLVQIGQPIIIPGPDFVFPSPRPEATP